ncbi:hypothetical protein V8C26DRAFT_387495 [Trichoderma gracile]
MYSLFFFFFFFIFFLFQVLHKGLISPHLDLPLHTKSIYSVSTTYDLWPLSLKGIVNEVGAFPLLVAPYSMPSLRT